MIFTEENDVTTTGSGGINIFAAQNYQDGSGRLSTQDGDITVRTGSALALSDIQTVNGAINLESTGSNVSISGDMTVGGGLSLTAEEDVILGSDVNLSTSDGSIVLDAEGNVQLYGNNEFLVASGNDLSVFQLVML